MAELAPLDLDATMAELAWLQPDPGPTRDLALRLVDEVCRLRRELDAAAGRLVARRVPGHYELTEKAYQLGPGDGR